MDIFCSEGRVISAPEDLEWTIGFDWVHIDKYIRHLGFEPRTLES